MVDLHDFLVAHVLQEMRDGSESFRLTKRISSITNLRKWALDVAAVDIGIVASRCVIDDAFEQFDNTWRARRAVEAFIDACTPFDPAKAEEVAVSSIDGSGINTYAVRVSMDDYGDILTFEVEFADGKATVNRQYSVTASGV